MLSLGLVWIWISIPSSQNKYTLGLKFPHQGFQAPAIKLVDVEGKAKNLSDFYGKPVFINYWASWCPPCQAEMPAIEKIYHEYTEEGLIVVSVNASNQDSLVDVQTFLQAYSINFPVYFDKNGEIGALYHITALPSSFFIGRDGRIVDIVIGGPLSEAQLRIQIESMLVGK